VFCSGVVGVWSVGFCSNLALDACLSWIKALFFNGISYGLGVGILVGPWWSNWIIFSLKGTVA